MNWIKRYYNWLHGQWPTGTIEALPEIREQGATALPGVTVVGDLTGIPLLKFSADTGARAVRHFLAEPEFANRKPTDNILDLVIIGGGVSGMAAALEAEKNDLRYEVFEASQPFSTIENFPRGKPIYTYPTDMTPAGELQFGVQADVKESLLEEMKAQTASITTTTRRAEKIVRANSRLEVHFAEDEPVVAHRVIVAIGRSGNYRQLNVPGEDLDKVMNRLHDPKEAAGKQVLVVGGGDSALETAVAVAEAGGQVTLSYRKPQWSRPKPDNIAAIEPLQADGKLKTLLSSSVTKIGADAVELDVNGESRTLSNDLVYTMIGREPPLDFFRRSRIPIAGEWTARTWAGFLTFFLFCFWVYHWKGFGLLKTGLLDPANWFQGFNPSNSNGILAALKNAMADPTFYYSLAYTLLIIVFGIRRIRRRRTPYVTRQTLSLMAFQIVPLFLLPVLIFPWMELRGLFDPGGSWRGFAEWFLINPGSGALEHWRAYGFILAWPLFFWNFFTDAPMWGWLILGSFQTFVLIPWMVRKWGKGAYCGWICSCGALAETLGDAHRHKMPHGPKWNRLNMIGQVVLALAVILVLLRIIAWMIPGTALFDNVLGLGGYGYKWIVDLMLAGVIGVGLYFHFSGRVWCRFVCPLAAWMHICARFSRFRIFADKKKCISCNVCTSVCHQGIDIMNFANKGEPMEDPQCVRCSACVQSCPTGVLTFGEINPKTNKPYKLDHVPASRFQLEASRG